MHEQSRLKKEEKKKYIKYSKDPISFIRDNRIGINNQTWSGEKLPLLDFEKDVLKSIHENKLSIIKKSRQMHMSSITAAYCAWKMIFHSEYNIIILSPKMDNSVRFIEMVRIILQNYSNDFFHWEDDFSKNNKSEIVLCNHSSIKAVPANESSGRGYTIHMLIIDEAAFINKLEYIYTAMIPGLSAIKDSKCIMISTPNGKNVFYEFWNKAIEGGNNFTPIQLDWKMNPKFNEGMEKIDGEWTSEWYRNMCKILNYNEDKIAQELWGEFVDNKKPVSKRVNFRLDSDIYDAMMKKLGGDYGISDYVRDLIKKDLNL